MSARLTSRNSANSAARTINFEDNAAFATILGGNFGMWSGLGPAARIVRSVSTPSAVVLAAAGVKNHVAREICSFWLRQAGPIEREWPWQALTARAAAELRIGAGFG